MDTKKIRIAMSILLAVNAVYIVARASIETELQGTLPWAVAISLFSVLLAGVVAIRGSVPVLIAKVCIWLGFVFIVLTAIGDPETPVPRANGVFWSYVELGWAGLFCLGALYLLGRLPRKGKAA